MPRLSHRTAHDNRNGRNHVNTVKYMKVSRLTLAAAAVIGGLAVGPSLSADDLRLADSLLALAYRHQYRLDALPTPESKPHLHVCDPVAGRDAPRFLLR